MTVSKMVVGGLTVVALIAAAGLILQNTKVEAQNQKLAAVNAQMQQQVQLASQPELPIAVGFRPAVFGHGQVARLEVQSREGMAVKAHIVDAASHASHDFIVNVDPGRFTEIGHMQGYTFEPGDELTLAHDGFKSKYWVVR